MSPRPMGAPTRSSYSPRAHHSPYNNSSAYQHMSPAASSITAQQSSSSSTRHYRSGSAGYYPSEPHAMVDYPKPRDTSSPLRPRALHLGNNTLPPPPSSIDKRLTSSMTTSSVQQQARFAPKYNRNESPTPTSKSSTSDPAGVLQFVPALEEASRNANSSHHTRARSLESSPNTSWDAIVEETKDMQHQSLNGMTPKHRQAKSDALVSPPSNSCLPKKAWPSSTSHSSTRHPKSLSSSYSPTDDVASAHYSHKQGARISSRIASLFSSRAVVKTTDDTASSREPLTTNTRRSNITSGNIHAAPPPPSPSYSSSSSGYVGWPGTQDKRGATVAMHCSSYEESSVGAGGGDGGNVSVASSILQPPPTSRRASYENELKAAAEREMERGWNVTGTVDEDAPSRADPSSNFPSSSSSSPMRNSLSSMRYSKDGHSPTAPPPAPQPGVVDQQQIESVSEEAALSFHNLFPNGDSSFPTGSSTWEVGSNPSSASYSKTSSAYFPAEAVPDVSTQLSFPDLTVTRDNNAASHPYASRSRGHRPDSVVRHRSASPVSLPTAETLAMNDHFSPPHRTFVGATGFRGLMEKTKEVPSLMDAVESESNASSMSKATSTAPSSIAPAGPPVIRNFRSSDRSVAESDVFDGISLSKESDVFDNLSNFDGRSSASPRKATSARSRVSYPERIAEEGDEDHGAGGEEFKLVVLPGGLATIQTTHTGFSNRKTASDYDENLTNSDIDQYGFARTPGFHEMLSAGTSRDSSLLGIDGNIGKNPRRRVVEPEDVTTSESGSSLFSDPYRFDEDHLSIDGDLSEYYIPAMSMKKVLRKYRKMSDCINEDISLEEFEREEDEHKAFALFEMRSRIMEKDIERGLERRGGTVPVDDLVTTPYYRTAYRIRDAVIVSKAWRDGASPKDVINTALLTRRAERTYYIKRPGRPNTSMMSDTLSTFSGVSMASQRSYWWEPVTWLDDTDFMLYRCPSLGPRNMRGSEMFTIGDCQSMLLKLTNEQCINLRRELNLATKRQIEAEYLLSDDGDVGDSMMTEAEMAYLGAMEEVKEISKKLVCAEQAFTLVKDRIQRLVARYEHLLSKIDTESFAGASSVVTYESSYYSEVESDVWEERERAIWARRAQRAEVKAELAAREALLAKQEVRMIQAEKQRELEALQQKLLELQSESSYHGAVDREHSSTLAKSMAMHRHDGHTPPPTSPQQPDEGRNDRQKIDDVKKRFRDRMAARKQETQVLQTMAPQAYAPMDATGKFGQLYNRHSQSSSLPHKAVTPSPTASLFRSAGEEMYQQLDFYERSLKAVERDERFAP